RANVNAVKTWYSQYLIQVSNGLPGFDHCQRDYRFVRVPLVVRPGVDTGTHRSAAAVALWMVTTRPNECLALSAAVNHRADYAVYPRVKHFHDDPWLVPIHTDERRCLSGGDGL